MRRVAQRRHGRVGSAKEAMPSTTERRWVRMLVSVTLAASILHYVDNIVFFDGYPEPAWITPHFIDAFWFVMTPFGVVGWLLWRQGVRGLSLFCLLSYGIMNLLTLGHYLYAPPWELPFRINAFILLEAFAAMGLIITVAAFAARNARPAT
jgi:hypothetical protein